MMSERIEPVEMLSHMDVGVIGEDPINMISLAARSHSGAIVTGQHQPGF